MVKQIKGLGLFSGGLDSMLATMILRSQKINVTGIFFTTPFFSSDQAKRSAIQIQLPLITIDITKKFLPLIYKPTYGFGRGHNPCIDCHILMIKEAAIIMEQKNFSFLFTGEVLGQRPMSQHKLAMNIIARESGISSLILRPLSAKLLSRTTPEIIGLVDREQLLDLSGRSRKKQVELAAIYGLIDYPSPAGGCLLTDLMYSIRLKEILSYQSKVSSIDIELLKYGRHFRLPCKSKIIVGRTQYENKKLENLNTQNDLILRTVGYPGPSVLIIGGSRNLKNDDLKIAAELTGAYSDAPYGIKISVEIQSLEIINYIYLENRHKSSFEKFLISL